MFKPNPVSLGVALALSALATAAAAQDTQRIEITGSSIKRIAAEGALPVQTITAEQIQRSGATSVAELVQKLPAMQGFTIADIAIGTNSGGRASASIHDLGEEYTLVLLNGRRLAPQGSGSGVNLHAIPMSAIERIEVLTDGASALYGSDAIAGVVNFVLKRRQDGGEITARADVPMERGGRSANASISYGFGDLDTNGFSVVGTFRRDTQKPLKAGDREFADNARISFSKDGKNYIYDRLSTFAVPGNATVTFRRLEGETSTLPSYSFNPYQKLTGNCAPLNYLSINNAVTATAISENCAFDFVSTIDTYPEYTRDAFFLSGEAKLGGTWKMFGDLAFTRIDLTARIAPNPVPVSISSTGAVFNEFVRPYLSDAQAARVNAVSASYRAVDFGTRDSQTITDSKHAVLGLEGDLGNWFVSSALTWSENSLDEKYTGGYFKDAEFRSLIANQLVNPFIEPGKQTASTQELIRNSIFNGSVRTASTQLTGVDVRASGEVFKLPAGAVSVGVGGDFRSYHFKQTPSGAALAGQIYNYAAVPRYDLKRDTSGVFTEVLVPVIKNLDLTGALRYDRVGSIDNGGATIGQKLDATTYKLSARYQISSAVLLRGSFGTGFKAPSMLAIAQPLVPNGVTAASWDCPFPGTDYCKAGKLQYSQMSGGNAQLKPEKSENTTFGIRLEPTNNFGIGFDYWQVDLKDAVSAVSANQAFADPQKYRDLFMLYRTPAETQDYWAFISSSTNIGRTTNKGVDWDVTARFATPIGRLTAGMTGTYLIRSAYTRPGTDNDWTDSMGRYGENAAVSFRNIARGTLSLDTGNFTNTLTVNYRSGYKDINATVRDVATNTNVRVALDVPTYVTYDWQTIYKPTKALELRLGIKNLLDKEPPLTLRDSSGHQVGYDPRYHDVFLRTVYLQGSYKF